ncbi:MAG TPA: hypothetical protein VKR60_12830 [Candidatus Sulfotelmatobacter sp.]|nr:hypothetical protein [Candidatus Sulfotelmatobacter sp.]
MLSPEAKQRIQIALTLAIVVAAVRAGYILYQRHEENLALEKKMQAKNAGYSNPDYYVAPKKLYPFDLNSAKQLTQQPVWAKEGYKYTYYPYDGARKRVDFAREAGLLLPIERLEIKDVVSDTPSEKGSRRQMMAVFQKDGKSYAVPIGFEADEEYKIYSDEMFYIEDPHQLYKHWSVDVWQAVDQHQVKLGMNELQADFAVGMGIPDSGSSSYEKTVRYPNGGKPLVVTYRDGKAAEITPGTPPS